MNAPLEARAHVVWQVLKYTYGLVAIVAGADKFFGLITNWSQYINPAILKMVPLSATHFLYAVGVIEILAGFLILTKWTKLGGYIVSAWLVLIALNLVTMGTYFDIAIRDIVMAVGAWALARLTNGK